MKLKQGQIWKKDREYFRIVERERLSVTYKALKHPSDAEGMKHQVTKKEFCRLIKGGQVLPDKPLIPPTPDS